MEGINQVVSKGCACVNMNTRAKYISLKVTIRELKINYPAFAKFSWMLFPLTAPNLSAPYLGMLLPAELCLSSCPALWFVQAPNPTWPAVVKDKMSRKPQSLFSGSDILLSHNLTPREAGATDRVLDLTGFTSEIQLLTSLWRLTGLAFFYLRNFPAQ